MGMVNNKPKTKRTLQLDIPKEVFNGLYVSIKDNLPPSFYVRPVIVMYRMQRSFRRTCEKMIQRGIIMSDVIFADIH